MDNLLHLFSLLFAETFLEEGRGRGQRPVNLINTSIKIVTGIQETMYTRNDSASYIVPLGDNPITLMSSMACARLCGSTATCNGIYHSLDEQTCYLYTDSNLQNYSQDTSATSFSKTATVIQTSDSPLLETSWLNCPLTFRQDIRLQGSSNNYTLKIVNLGVNQTIADHTCASNGMTLFRPDSENKINDVSQFLNTCVVYNATGYWTDAKRQTHETGQPWKFSNGVAVPINVWCGNVPGSDHLDDCARMDVACSFKMADKQCHHNDPSWGFICE